MHQNGCFPTNRKNQRDYMIAAKTSDPILLKMRPMAAQRGLSAQSYADHSRGDRCDCFWERHSTA
jgi:hypothetical protein